MSERIEKWDILKFFLIFLVVVGHVIEVFADSSEAMKALKFYIYTFHMPVFVFVSGLFSKKNINEKRYNKIAVYLFLFLITKIILFCSRIIAYKTATFSLTSVNDLPWYMLALFVFSLITIALRKVSPAYVFLLFIALSCVAGYDASLGDTFASMRMIVFYPFFYAGYCFNPKKLVELTDKKYLKIISAVLLIAYALFVFFNIDKLIQFKPLLSAHTPYDTLGKYRNYGFILRAFYYIAVSVIGMAVICIIPKKLGRGMTARLGRRSVQVYMLHYSLIHIIDGRIIPVLPDIPDAVAVPVFAVLITFICSLRIWEPIFKIFMNPETALRRKEK